MVNHKYCEEYYHIYCEEYAGIMRGAKNFEKMKEQE